MKKMTKFKKTSLLVFSLVMTSFGVIKISNINSAHAETKIYNGQPYDIVVKYEPLEKEFYCDNSLNDDPSNPCEEPTEEDRKVIKEFYIEVAKAQGFVTEKIPGTGTPEGDLQKVKQYIELRKKDAVDHYNDVEEKWRISSNYYEFIVPESLKLDESMLPDECNPTQVYTVKYEAGQFVVPPVI